MTRPRKQTVDYFPHSVYVNSGKTIPALIAKFGEQGYSFWFRMLELLGKTPGHGYDCNDELDWTYFQAYTFVNDEFLTSEILSYAVKLHAIDRGAWALRGIWCQNFVDGVGNVYRNRKEDIPTYKDFLRKLSDHKGISDADNPQTIEKENRAEKGGGEKEKEKEITPPPVFYERYVGEKPNNGIIEGLNKLSETYGYSQTNGAIIESIETGKEKPAIKYIEKILIRWNGNNQSVETSGTW